MRQKGLIVGLVMCLCVSAGCAVLQEVAIDTAIAIAPDKPIFGKKKAEKNFIPNVDTKDTITQELGQPNEIIVVDTNKKVLAYETYHGKITHLYALKNKIYQNNLEVTTRDFKEDKAKRVLKNKLVRIFPCFQETVTYKTPPTPASTSSSIPTTSFAPFVVPASY